MSESIRETCQTAIRELLAAARLHRGDIVVIGCSSSEVLGEKIGTHSSYETAEEIHAAIAPILAEEGLWLAAQCCEHLNRAIILEREAAEKYGYDQVTSCPSPRQGARSPRLPMRILQSLLQWSKLRRMRAWILATH